MPVHSSATGLSQVAETSATERISAAGEKVSTGIRTSTLGSSAISRDTVAKTSLLPIEAAVRSVGLAAPTKPGSRSRKVAWVASW